MKPRIYRFKVWGYIDEKGRIVKTHKGKPIIDTELDRLFMNAHSGAIRGELVFRIPARRKRR